MEEIILTNLPYYLSNIVYKKKGHGHAGQIIINYNDLAFFNMSSDEIDKANYQHVNFRNVDQFYFLKDDILEYLESFKEEYLTPCLHTYKIFTRNADEWKSVSQEGLDKRKEIISTYPNQIFFEPHIKPTTSKRYFFGCNTSDEYSLIIKYSLIPIYTEILVIKEVNIKGGYDFRFVLRKIDDIQAFNKFKECSNEIEKIAYKKNLDSLYDIAKNKNKKRRKNISTNIYYRDPYVSAFVKRRAKGKCDLCKSDAPFFTKQAIPYLEEHHLIPLSDGGDDSIDNAVALCPNCHRKMHSLNLKADYNELKKVIKKYQDEFNIE